MWGSGRERGDNWKPRSLSFSFPLSYWVGRRASVSLQGVPGQEERVLG